jgi:hypothetical protein
MDKPQLINKFDINKFDINKFDINKFDINKFDRTPHPEPKIGHYGYYDSRLTKYLSYIVKTENGDGFGCHYSKPTKDPYEVFITCHGKIIETTHNPYNNDAK